MERSDPLHRARQRSIASGRTPARVASIAQHASAGSVRNDGGRRLGPDARGMAGAAQAETAVMITIYGYSPSGNCHKLRMLLGHLGREYRWIETDSAHGATRTPDYLAKNPNGKDRKSVV